MALALCLNSLHVVRGAPTQTAGPSVGNASLPKGSALRRCRRRGIRPVSQSKTVIDQLLARSLGGLQVRSASVPCAGWSSSLRWQRVATQRALLHCAAGSVAASSAQRCASHPFVRTRGGAGQVSGRSCCAKSQGAGRKVWRPPHNKSLQRAGTHKVLGRGRPSRFFHLSFPRPRADKSARGR